MEGLEWDTPKGKMVMRADDHQALQSMYHFKIAVKDGVEWAVPELVKEIGIDEMQVPIRNKK
jgi:branched-chain amino acid transport system substrate-binding protein